ncbi:MAG: RDD family protein [Chloroflexi bacterium]|nr:RDD family protein [Chloroflexota bacterium]
MPVPVVVGIAAVCAAASAVNGLIGTAFLLIIYMWLTAGVVPMVPRILKEEAQYAWMPQLLLPLMLFLVVWQWKLRGRLGPRITLRNFLRGERAALPSQELVYAGVKQRIAADVIDLLALGVIFVALIIVKPALGAFSFLRDATDIITAIVAVLVPWLYFAGLHSSDGQATFGKKYVGIVVGDENGNRISFSKATIRLLVKVATLGLGTLLIFFNGKHLALQDKIAKTTVTNEI